MAYSITKLCEKLEPVLSVVFLLYVMEPNLAERGAPPVLGILDKLLVASYYLFSLFVTFRHWKKILYFLTSNKILLLLLLLPVVSIIWSINPDTSLNRFYRVVVRSAIFGLYLASRYSPKELMRLVGVVLSIAMGLSIVVALGLPSYGARGDSWQGIFAHKNHLGPFAALAVVYFSLIAVYVRRYRKLALLGILFAFIALIFSAAKSSLVICLGTLAILPLYRSFLHAYRSKIFTQLVLLLVGGTLTSLLAINAEYIIVNILGKSLALNGRLPLWTYLLGQVAKRPLFGYGYEAFWTDSEQLYLGERYVGWFPSHGHSGFIDMLLQLGTVGLALFALCSLLNAIRLLLLLNATRSIEYFWMLLFLVVMVSSQYSVGNTMLKDHLFWVLYVSFSSSAAVELRRVRKIQQMKHSQTFIPAI